MDLDTFAGIGGWRLAIGGTGRHHYSIEHERRAREALVANGIRLAPLDDVIEAARLARRRLSTFLLAPIRVLAGSPPCQPWSQANGTARGLDDPRGALMHAYRDLALHTRPEVVLGENVKATAWVWQELADDLTRAGYSADVRKVNAADYGLPQARVRVLLAARRDGAPIEWPEPTHADPATRYGATLIADGARKPWVTLAEALPHRDDLPAWAHARPATTIVGSFRPEILAPPTYRRPGDGPRQNQPGGVTTTLEERLTLQGFPSGWHTSGPATARALQVGNAIPPALAAVAVAAAGVTPAPLPA